MGLFDAGARVNANVRIGVRVSSPGTRAFDVAAPHAVSLVAFLFDGIIITCLSVCANFAYQSLRYHGAADPLSYALVGAVVSVLFSGLTKLLCNAHPIQKSCAIERAKAAVSAWFITFLLLSVLAFALKAGSEFSRGSIITLFCVGLPVVVASRVIVPPSVGRLRLPLSRKGKEIVIGASHGDDRLPQLRAELSAEGCSVIHTVFLDVGCSSADWPSQQEKFVQKLLETIRGTGASEIYLLMAQVPKELVASIISCLRFAPQSIFVLPDIAIASYLQYDIRSVGAFVAVELNRAPLSTLQRAIKRCIDLSIGLMILFFIAPILLVIALTIKLDSTGPVLFRQCRSGYLGKPFRIFKFRTMTVQEDGTRVVQARPDDERFTRVGRWLRRTSLDELPQLINVLSGEMSLIGPRPHALVHDEQYSQIIEYYSMRQFVKPGITGWAQIHGLRGPTPTIDLMYRRVEYDLWYATNCSLVLDLVILFRTPFAIWGRSGAY